MDEMQPLYGGEQERSDSVATAGKELDSIITDIDIERIDYTIIAKNYKDIIKELKIKNEDEEILTTDIIMSLETFAAECYKNGKCVALPYIGRVRINEKVKDIKKIKDEIKEARKNSTKEEFREFLVDKYKGIYKNINDKDIFKRDFNKLRSKLKIEYEKLYSKLGKVYADMYIATRMKFNAVEHNDEDEEILKNMK